MKPDYVYHGSARNLVGARIKPQKAKDLSGKRENSYTGIYATDIRDHAVIMAILGSRGVNGSSLSLNDPEAKGIVYDGWPEQKEVFVYDLQSTNFRRTAPNSHQWISFDSIKPSRIETINVNDYIHMVREATAEEKNAWIEKHSKKLKS